MLVHYYLVIKSPLPPFNYIHSPCMQQTRAAANNVIAAILSPL